MNWETKRKIVYALAFLTAVAAIIVFLLRGILFPEPTCYDTKQNGFETGIDCGGACLLMCKEDVVPLTVLWAKALRTEEGIYDLVGLIQNKNIDNASREIGYTFNAYDDDGNILITKSATTTAPLDGTFPLILQNVLLSQAPRRVVLELQDTAHYKVLENPESPTVKVIDRQYEGGAVPRIYTRIYNAKRIEIRNLPVRVIALDQNENAFAAGETIIPFLGKESYQDAIFTWKEPFPIAPARILVYPIFNPFDAIQ